MFNKIWDTGTFSDSWKEATIILMPKPGKDDTNLAYYRPIALTICICKTMGRMITEWLICYRESSTPITSFQSGFKNNWVHLTTWSIVSNHPKGFHQNRTYGVCVSLPRRGVYDSIKVWNNAGLTCIGTSWKTPQLIEDFLSGRSFHVRVGWG